MPVERLKEALNAKGIRYVIMSHSPAYTAQEVAAATHIPGRELAKVVMVKLDGKMVMTVLPASHRVNLERLATSTGAWHAELATEDDFSEMFSGCEIGAMPPFGRLWDLPTYASDALLEDDEIAFNACNHTEVMFLPLRDWFHVAEPKIVTFSEPLD
jgi:Ala-tRNA(Pro) deacylase